MYVIHKVLYYKEFINIIIKVRDPREAPDKTPCFKVQIIKYYFMYNAY